MMGGGRRTKFIISVIIGTGLLMMGGAPLIIAIIFSFLYAWVSRGKPSSDGPDAERATNYPKCPMCGGREWVAKSSADIVYKWTYIYVRQMFACADPQCDIVVKLVRQSDATAWDFAAAYVV